MTAPLPIDIFNKLTEAFADIYVSQRNVKSSAEKSLKAAAIQKDYLDKNPRESKFDRVVSMQNMHFRRFDNNQILFFDHRQTTIDELIDSIILSKNRQYQWLLAEAYEAFEDFIQDSYAIAGFYDNEVWPLADYGNITLSELPRKDFAWFRDKAEKKKNSPNSAMELFRQKFPAIQAIESKNHREINLYFMIKLIEIMRHVIVHRRGEVLDIDTFTKRVLESCGMYNSGKPEPTYTETINSYFFSNEKLRNKIRLLEIPLHDELPLPMHINLFEETCNYLLGYAQIITSQITAHLDKKIGNAST